MKRSSLIAALLTIGLHALALGGLSLWSIGGGDVAHALDALPGPVMPPAPSSPVVPARDTVSLPIVTPDIAPAQGEGAGAATVDRTSQVTAEPGGRTEVTPILMLSWQKGGNRRKTFGYLPTLEGPLAEDVTTSFKVMVTPDGNVRSVRVVKGKDAGFERAAVTRIKKWKFEPLRSGGKPADQLCTVTLKARAR